MTASEILDRYSQGKRDFRTADLQGQIFAGCDLSDADFSGADLRGANFTGARLQNTKFANTKCGLLGRSQLKISLVLLALVTATAFTTVLGAAFAGGTNTHASSFVGRTGGRASISPD